MPRRLALIFLLLTACAPLPGLPGPEAADLPTPKILPLDEILAAAPTGTATDTTGPALAARAAALRARAAALRSLN